jgi:ABC-2 type transport system ATP-binding protein
MSGELTRESRVPTPIDGCETGGRIDRRLDALANERLGNAPRETLLAKVEDDVGQLAFVHAGDQLCGGLAAGAVHAHVERFVPLEAEAASRFVELHRGHAEVGQRAVDRGDAALVECACEIAVVGVNGAGKSTTLEIIETLREKTSGKVFVDGIDLDRSPNEIKKRIGVQLQTSGYYPNLNLTELLILFGGLYNRDIRPSDFLGKVNLLDKAKSKYKVLSGGQKQRFSIATTLINQPKIIFLDEPTTGLDPQARRNLWDLVRDIRSSGTTVIITTHYMDEAEVLCDRVAIMDSGKIIALDSPDQLIDKLVASGFERPKEVKKANLEDVFIQMTGKEWREE